MNVIISSTRHACLVSAFVFLVGQATSTSTSAQKFLIDFGNNNTQYRGIPVPNPDPNGHYWNSIQPGLLVSNMIDINNAATTVALGWSTPVGTDSYNGPAGPAGDNPPTPAPIANLIYDKVALGDLGVDQAVIDYAASPILDNEDTRCRFDLENLDPSRKYSLTFFGSHKYSNDATTVYHVYSDLAYTNLIGSASLNVCDPADTSQHNEDQVVTINNLSPVVGVGVLYVQFQSVTGNLGYLNAMEIVASAPVGITGDYNSDGKVNAADYTVWRDHLGQTFALPNRDPANGSGAISAADYTSWKNHFTAGGSGASASGAVPEPGTFVLFIMAIIGLAGFSKRR